MSEATLTKSTRKATTHYESVAAQLLQEIVRLEERIEEDHAESERLKTETQIIKNHTAVTLSQLQEQLSRLAREA